MEWILCIGLNKDQIYICPGDLTPFIEISVLLTMLCNAAFVVNQEPVNTQICFRILFCSTDLSILASIS